MKKRYTVGLFRVSCINKTFEVLNGSGQICQLPAGAEAQVQLLPSQFQNGASGGFSVI